MVPGIGASSLQLLQSAHPPIETALATLLNDLQDVPDEIYLVLDDYHLADGAELQDGMAFFLEHLPRQIHLVIASRADPALPLAKLRAHGQLVEIRGSDLRFTPEEAAAYLNEVMGLALTAPDVAALEARTEGWIAALQLAALSMQGRDDVASFIAGFAGDDRYIVDYLAEEVLARQPTEVRDFLLRTSILERLSGPLTDAVLGRTDGRAALVALERANLFVVPLDDRRQWYRYHHLFADVLQAHLLAEHGDDVPELHRRASVWFEHDDEPAEAVRHALSGGDLARAADLMELTIPALRRTRQEAQIRGWARLLPDEVVRDRPVLGMGFVGALASSSEFDSIEQRLHDIERFVRPATAPGAPLGPPAPPAVVVDEEEYQRLPGGIEMYRAALDLARGDLDGTVAHAHRAMELAPPDDHLIRAGAAGLWGLASWTTGDLDAAHQAYVACAAGLQRAGFVSDVLGCTITLADIRRTQGHLSDALRTYESALELAAPEPGAPPPRGTADMHVGISDILRERDDRAGAALHLATSHQLGEPNGLPRNPYRWRVAMAQLREAEGDADGALELLNEADRVYDGDYAPNVRPVPAVRARLWIRRGELDAAGAWARARRLFPDDELSYLREYEHVTLARLLLARHASGRTGAVPRRGDRPADTPARRCRTWRARRDRRGGTRPSGAGPPSTGRRRRRAGPAGAGRDAGRAGGLRPGVRGRGPAHGLPAAGGGQEGRRPRLRPSAPGSGRPGAAQCARPHRLDRRTERARAGRAAAARDRAGRSSDRPPARGVTEHGAVAHQEHLRQARRQQPARGRSSGQGSSTPSCSSPRRSPHVVMPAHHIGS